MFYIPLPPDHSLHQNIYERNTCALDNDTCDHVLMADKYLDIAGASLAEIEDVYRFPQLRIVSTTKWSCFTHRKNITSIAGASLGRDWWCLWFNSETNTWSIARIDEYGRWNNWGEKNTLLLWSCFIRQHRPNIFIYSFDDNERWNCLQPKYLPLGIIFHPSALTSNTSR